MHSCHIVFYLLMHSMLEKKKLRLKKLRLDNLNRNRSSVHLFNSLHFKLQLYFKFQGLLAAMKTFFRKTNNTFHIKKMKYLFFTDKTSQRNWNIHNVLTILYLFHDIPLTHVLCILLVVLLIFT